MNVTVRNPKLIAFRIDDFDGEAGFVEKRDREGRPLAELAFKPKRMTVDPGRALEADGRRWTVHYVTARNGFRILGLKPLPPSP